MKRYYINYHTGAGNEYADTLEEAMQLADEGANYTQENITIEDTENGEVVAKRTWWGVEYDENDEDTYCENPICFASFGYYDDWWVM